MTTPDSVHGLVAARDDALADDDVVELEVLLGRDRDPERERGGVVGAEDAPDGVRRRRAGGSGMRRRYRRGETESADASGRSAAAAVLDTGRDAVSRI